MTNDPRETVWSFFSDLLSPNGKPRTIAAIGKARKARSTVEAYRAFMLERLNWGNPEKPSETASASRAEEYGLLYLDLALRFRDFLAEGRHPDDFALQVEPDLALLDPKRVPDRDVLTAMAAELGSLYALLAQPDAGPSDATHPLVRASRMDRMAAGRARSTDGNCEPGMHWFPRSHTNVAIADTGDAGSRPAHVATLRIRLGKVVRSCGEEVRDDEPFSIRLFPSLLSALDYFSPRQDNTVSGSPGWWGTLHTAEHWVAGHYEEIASKGGAGESRLTGPHVACWDLALRPAVNRRDDKIATLIEGSSHGAAFSACLMQAVARAHLPLMDQAGG